MSEFHTIICMYFPALWWILSLSRKLRVILLLEMTDVRWNHLHGIRFNASYNKDGNFRSRSASRAGRTMGNGSFERSWTPHEHTLCAFLIFALPALPGAKIALPLLWEVLWTGVIRIVPFKRWPRRGPMGGRQSAFKRLQIFALPALPSAKIALPPL